MATEIKAYKCDYCHKCFGRNINAIQHEKYCRNNPASRHCKTCIHGYLKTITHTGNEVYGDTAELLGKSNYSYNEKIPYCDMYNMAIHGEPFYIECEVDDGTGENIPFTCACYEYKGYAGYKLKGGVA